MHLAPHAADNVFKDRIFEVAARARAAKAAHGAENVVDGSIGILLDDDGEPAMLPAVEEATRRLAVKDVAVYAPTAGLPQFREDAPAYVFGEALDRTRVDCVATAGATGALRLCVWNFLEQDEAFVTHDFFWSPYGAIARDAMRRVETFPTYREDQTFNVAGAVAKTAETLERQGRALLIVNTPCHNPTGIDLSAAEAQALSAGLTDLANAHPNKPITLLVDGAYWEFGNEDANRALIKAFRELPENLLFCMTYTLSKSFTRYGFRTGALIMSNANRERLDHLVKVMNTSVRSTWSNTCRLGQAIFSTVYRDPELLADLRAQQRDFAAACNSKGHRFTEDARRLGLPLTPYRNGFFATIPTAESEAFAARLMAENMFFIPMKKGVRVAFCSIPAPKIEGLAERAARLL